MNTPRLASVKECTGCLACIDSCPTESLTKIINKEGHFFYRLNIDTCIHCNKCVKTCPVVSNLEYSLEGEGTFYAAWAKDNDIRAKSASGGAFAAVAKYVLDNQGVVFGAAKDDICNVRHIYIEDNSELPRIQGSKYAASDTVDSYKKVYAFLKEGRLVLFSGVGCQVAGLLASLKNKPYKGKLITIDLICGGIPSRLLVQKFIENEPYKLKEIISFRTKDNGWKSSGFLYNMKVKDINDQIHDYSGVRNLVIDGFCSELTNRYSCYNCKFNGIHRLSDYTIGDLWGDKDHLSEHKKGLSLVIAHTEKAISLLMDLKKYLATDSINAAEAIKSNPRITNGKSYKKYMPERIYLSCLFNKMNYSTLKKIYAFDFSLYSPWIIYKAYRYMLTKLFK